LIQLLKIFRDDYTRHIDGRSKISAEAYVLRRQLRSWLAELPLAQASSLDQARAIAQHMDTAETRMTALAALLSLSSAKSGAAIRSALVLFLKGTNTINEQLLLHQLQNTYSSDAIAQAFKDFADAVKHLEQLVDPALRSEDARRDATPGLGRYGKSRESSAG
jgi:hypothetical protein